MHIRLITPHVTARPGKLDDVNALRDVDTALMLSQVGLKTGPASIESRFDEVLSAPGVVARAVEAEAEGVDAVIIDCMGDPGLGAAREAVSIPVFGPGETSMHVAAMISERFSVVSVLDRVRPILVEHAHNYGVAGKLASVRSVNVPVLEISHDTERLVAALVDESRKAILEDKADAIVLGCTGFTGVGERLEKELERDSLPAPVINPMRACVAMAAAYLRLGISHSPLSYPHPGVKKIAGYEIGELRKKPESRRS